MSNILFDLSGKIDEQTVDALFAVKKEADALSIPFFVIGASARDIILKHCYGIEPQRVTKDIDIGVEVASWEQFNQLTDSLMAGGQFSPTSERQRFRFDTLLIDIVPFGTLADEHGRISWPPEHEIFMSIVGFKEVYKCSITVRLSSDPALDIKVPNLPGLALMKIISWKDGYPDRKKDAEDLLLIMHKYEQAGNFDRLYDEEQELLQEEDFDTRLAGIRLLGRDMATMADNDAAKMVKNILDAETGQQSQYRLTIDMIRGTHMFDGHFEATNLQIEKLRKGFVEVAEKRY